MLQRLLLAAIRRHALDIVKGAGDNFSKQRMCKILLIQPNAGPISIGEGMYMHEPLALEYVGAGVSKDHEVRLLDLRLEDTLVKTLQEFQPAIVGVTGYTFHANRVVAICRQIKEVNPQILNIVGGHHATVMPQTFNCPWIDVIVIGDGTTALQAIVRAFEQNRDFSPIAGLAIPKNGELYFTHSQVYPSLDSLPMPDRQLTAANRHRYFSEWFDSVASIRTSKGCAFRCKFCSLHREAESKYLTRDSSLIIEELKNIQEPFVFFSDDESFLHIKRMDALADLIAQNNISKKFFMYARTDTIAKFPELFQKWKKIGLERVLIGLESNRQQDLDNYEKRNDIATNEKAISLLKEWDISIYASFIVAPDFGEEDFDNMVKYVNKLDLENPYFSMLTPFPGSELYEENRACLQAPNWDLFDFGHMVLPTKISLEKFYREYYYLYAKTFQIKKWQKRATNPNPDLEKRIQKDWDKVRNAYNFHIASDHK